MNNIWYIIAAGPSYMDVTEKEWKFLKDKHTITFSRVPYGSKKFEYYMSIERNYLDASVLKYMAKLGNLDTKLLLSIPESVQLARKLGFKSVRRIVKENFYFFPSRRPWFADEEYPPHKFIETRAPNFHFPLFRFRGQLSAVINCALILGAEEIRLIGVDLNNQKNFYQYPEILRKVCRDRRTIEEYEGLDKQLHEKSMESKIELYPDFNPKIMHSTNIPYVEPNYGKPLKGIADVIHWMDEELREEGKNGIYVCNKNSLLFKENKVKYKEIMDESN